MTAKKSISSPEIRAWQAETVKSFRSLSRVARSEITWVTIVIAAHVVEPGDHAEIIAADITDFRNRLVRRCKKWLPGTRWRGAFEIDILHPAVLRHCPHKRELVAAVGCDAEAARPEQRVLVPHLHAIMDRRGHDADRLTDHLRSEFRGPRRVLGKPIFDNGTVRDQLTSLGNYSSKMMVAYSEAWAERETRYTIAYEQEWVETFARTVSGVGLRGMSFRHGGS